MMSGYDNRPALIGQRAFKASQEQKKSRSRYSPYIWDVKHFKVAALAHFGGRRRVAAVYGQTEIRNNHGSKQPGAKQVVKTSEARDNGLKDSRSREARSGRTGEDRGRDEGVYGASVGVRPADLQMLVGESGAGHAGKRTRYDSSGSHDSCQINSHTHTHTRSQIRAAIQKHKETHTSGLLTF